MLRFILAITLVCTAVNCPADETNDSPQTPSDAKKFHLFLLAGQSNMAGRGKVQAEDLKIHPQILMLNKAGEWVPAIDPLHFDKPGIVGVGLGKTFAIQYAAEHPDVTIGLIPLCGWRPLQSTRGFPVAITSKQRHIHMTTALRECRKLCPSEL